MTVSNLFFNRGPVSDPAYFFGRKQELAQLFELLGRGQSVSISGQRRIGKSSLLYHCMNPEICARYGLDPLRTRWINLDGGLYDGLEEDSVYAAIARSIIGDGPETLPYTDLIIHVRRLAEKNLRLIVVMDEFEIFAENPRFQDHLFKRFRGIAAPQFPVQFIISSKEPLAKYSLSHPEIVSSPFFTNFAAFRLALFQEIEAVELLTELSTRGGAGFQTETIAFLLEMVGYHPHFLQVAGYNAFYLLQRGALTLETRAEIKERTMEQLEGHLEYYWRDLNQEEQYTLSGLSLRSVEGYSPLIARLTDMGLLFEKRYPGSILREFVARKPVAGLLRWGPFVMDEHRRLLTVNGELMHLTPTEFAAMRMFLQNPDRLLSWEDIEATLWPEQIALDPERARGIVKKLRGTVGEAGDWIYVKRGQGVLLTQPDQIEGPL